MEEEVEGDTYPAAKYVPSALTRPVASIIKMRVN
jgi:hypothetical protein